MWWWICHWSLGHSSVRSGVYDLWAWIVMLLGIENRRGYQLSPVFLYLTWVPHRFGGMFPLSSLVLFSLIISCYLLLVFWLGGYSLILQLFVPIFLSFDLIFYQSSSSHHIVSLLSFSCLLVVVPGHISGIVL